MNATVGKLKVEAPEDRPETIMTRTFHAPRDLVFKAHSSCEHVSQWWGPRRHSFAHCEMDFVEGGAWRFVLRDADGSEYPFTGEFREIQAPERLTWTFVFDVEPFNNEAAITTLTLEDLGGRTKLTSRDRFPSVESLEGALATGMVGGALQTWDRLATELAAA